MIELIQPVKGKLEKRPKGIITQFFGANPEIYKKMTGKDGHSGIDLATFFGDLIYAAHDGIVEKTKYYDSCKLGGRYVRILSDKQKDDIYIHSYYGHIKDILVKEGDKVSAGQKIATQGNTGACKHNSEGIYVPAYTLKDYQGTHLHFGIKFYVDAKPGDFSYGIAGRSLRLLNADNGYRGNIDPLPYLLKTFMRHVIDKRDEQFLLDDTLKIALNIGDEEELLKLTIRGIGTAEKIKEIPSDYLIYPLVSRERWKDLLGL